MVAQSRLASMAWPAACRVNYGRQLGRQFDSISNDDHLHLSDMEQVARQFVARRYGALLRIADERLIRSHARANAAL